MMAENRRKFQIVTLQKNETGLNLELILSILVYILFLNNHKTRR